ncbi:TlpA disulfide reductase family protein [Microbacter sp. GSS18]|nr:TlpA disulfide reductase family protein [Microbacter sp. GSS18]
MTFLARRGRAAASALAALTLTAVIAGCSADPLAEQYRAGDNKGFIAADGFRVVEVPEDERGEPVEFSGVLDTGDAVSSDEYAGDVVVVNFWYAACAPCRVEAPELAAAAAEFADEQVSFLGVNIYDGADASLAFAETYGIEYPSALATEDGSIKLAFADVTPLNAVPTTVVLDAEGRVAARFIGAVTGESYSILTTVVDDLLDES